MSSMSKVNLRDIALVITPIVGFFILFSYFVKSPEVNSAASLLTKIVTVIMGLAGLLGIGNLTKIHLKRVTHKSKNWIPSLVLLISMYIPLVIGLLLTRKCPTYTYIYSKIYTPVSMSFFAILSFYILSGAYRAFRVRNFESLIMVGSAIIVFLGNAPISGLLWGGFPAVTLWLFIAPNAAGYRGILIGIAIGLIITGIRTLLGRERGYLGGLGREEG